jgi:uncharacterized membrane protein YphA (DoxX/SURF4 family)
MNITLWIIAGVLAAGFAAAGAMKLAQPRAKLAASGMGWTEDYSDSQVKAIGAVEILGAIGLILPPALDIAPMLCALAAAGLAITMLLAAALHVRRGENSKLAAPLVLAALAIFVAVMRFGPNSF